MKPFSIERVLQAVLWLAIACALFREFGRGRLEARHVDYFAFAAASAACGAGVGLLWDRPVAGALTGLIVLPVLVFSALILIAFLAAAALYFGT